MSQKRITKKDTEQIIEQIIKELLKIKVKSYDDLDCFKKKIAKKFNIKTLSNADLLKAYHKIKPKKRQEALESLLVKRKIRSLSGVAVVSVLTKPYPCPGKCIFCPSEKGMPKSYLSNEPAVMRAVLNNFDPYRQTQARIKALEANGHKTDKIELIIIGGTWSYLPKAYQKWFVKRCFEACNNASNAQKPKKKAKPSSLEQEQKKNEKAKRRIIGITIETRPDYIDEEEIIRLRKFGVTRVELGVQGIDDNILRISKRGHTSKETAKATKLLKSAGFKICYHIMVNLPGSNIKKDIKMFEQIFKNPDFKPDLLKIYPCAILKGTNLYKQWKAKKYKPYTEKEMLFLLKELKKRVPFYCRIQRLIRDIPSQSIVAGPAKISNLRQIIAKHAKSEKWKCHCIRCREVRDNYNPREKLRLFRYDYSASQGKEIFLSYESKNRERLYSLLRLRIPGKDKISPKEKSSCSGRVLQELPVLKDSAIIREVHTYGKLLQISNKAFKISPQHKGLGKKLIKKAEKISSAEFKINKIAVISGIGARKYYSKLKYKLQDTYMAKKI